MKREKKQATRKKMGESKKPNCKRKQQKKSDLGNGKRE